jgi:ubiquinone/menaquinone biosynthesis C-methylase UbiE
MKAPTERFSATVENYIKYRPSYPKEIINFLVDTYSFDPNKIIADIGSGTGILTKLFLDNGNFVYGVEPNQGMREAGETILKDYEKFRSINGTAEATTLPSASIDIITVGTAFHWFDNEKSKIEFKRILKSLGLVVIIWNVRDIKESSLMDEYEQLIIKYGTDYVDSTAQKFDKGDLENFFSPSQMKTCVFENSQSFDWLGLQGRLLSTSYSLRPTDEKYEEMMAALKNLYDKYQKNGQVEFLYQTKMYCGYLKF